MSENVTPNSYAPNEMDNGCKTYAANNYNGPVVVVNAMPTKQGGQAAGSLACGIIGLISFWSIAPSFVIAIVGLILGIVAFAKKTPQKGITIAGIITSILALVLSVATFIICFIVGALMAL